MALVNSGVRVFLENYIVKKLFTPAGVNRFQDGHFLLLPAKTRTPAV